MSLPAHPLLHALERIFPHQNVRTRKVPAGLLLEADHPIRSEFLPDLDFRSGLVRAPGAETPLPAELKTPYFVAQIDAAHTPASEHIALTLWRKKPAALEGGDLRLVRVEDVPTLEAYKAMDPMDQAPKGTIDAYTEWFLAYRGQGPEPVGKARVTDVSNGQYFVSRLRGGPGPGFGSTDLLGAIEHHYAQRGAEALLLLGAKGGRPPEGFVHSADVLIEWTLP